MRAYSAAQQRLDHGGGYRWRDGVLAVLRGLGFDEEPTPSGGSRPSPAAS